MRALSNFDIEDYFKGYRQFGGVFSKNLLPKVIKNKCYIVNMQSDNEGDNEGSHWVAILNCNKKETCYFDSYGVASAPKIVEHFMKGSHKRIVRNEIDYQAMNGPNSNSCGEFCIYVVEKALKGNRMNEILAKFTLSPVINEQILLEFFGHEAFTKKALNRSIRRHKSKITGEGLRDIYNYMKRKISNAVETVQQIVKGVRHTASPPLRHYLSEHGDKVIQAMKVCRKPIKGILEKALNVLSLGQYERNKADLQYDKMFHLYFIVRFVDGSVMKLEKNEVVEIGKTDWESQQNVESLPIQLINGVTLNSMFKNAEAAIGPEKLFVYDAVKSNCQNFAEFMLQYSHLLTEELRTFIMQNAEGVMKHLSLLQSVGKQVTDVAHLGDILYHGKGLNPYRRK